MVAASRRLVIAGLGNYTHPLTRHSIGQVLLKSLAYKAASLPSSSGSPILKLDKTHHAWLTTITLKNPDTLPIELLFCLPRQLMNISGPPIVSSLRGFLPNPIETWKILTLQDDLDLAPSIYKLQRGGSPRGHNGVRSLENALGSRDFYRIRLGIGRPEQRSDVASFVLGPLERDQVRSVEWDEGIAKGGDLVEKVWKEVMAIAQPE